MAVDKRNNGAASMATCGRLNDGAGRGSAKGPADDGPARSTAREGAAGDRAALPSFGFTISRPRLPRLVLFHIRHAMAFPRGRNRGGNGPGGGSKWPGSPTRVATGRQEPENGPAGPPDGLCGSIIFSKLL